MDENNEFSTIGDYIGEELEKIANTLQSCMDKLYKLAKYKIQVETEQDEEGEITPSVLEAPKRKTKTPITGRPKKELTAESIAEIRRLRFEEHKTIKEIKEILRIGDRRVHEALDREPIPENE